MDKVISFRIQDSEVYFKLCRYAEMHGTTVSKLIRQAIEDFISSLDNDKEKENNG